MNHLGDLRLQLALGPEFIQHRKGVSTIRTKLSFRPLDQRIMGRVVKTWAGYRTQCWLWPATNPASANGYPKIKIDGVSYYVHRVSYQLFVGEIPKGLQVDHLCHNKACVRPDHLEPVTPLVNVRRRRRKNGTQTG